MLSEGQLDCEEIVQPVIPFEESVQAYLDIHDHPERSVKLGVDFSGGA
jgi:hypothetical protein